MRTIKFRAWDTFDKKFLFPWPEGFYIFGETTCFDLVCQQLTKREGIPSLLRMNDVEIQQFTGLKDKNGKEIYEGDMVRVRCCGKIATMHVYFKGGCFGWGRRDGEHLGAYSFDPFEKGDSPEVIGNRYENPELLENK